MADPGCSGAGDNDESNPAPTTTTGGTTSSTTGSSTTTGGGDTSSTTTGSSTTSTTGGDTSTTGGSNLPDVKNPFEAGKGKGKKHKADFEFSDKSQAKGEGDKRKPDAPNPIRRPDGTPTNSNPSVSIADFGAAPIGVPNFMISQFSIPPFLLPIYQACGTQYGIPWEVLASINRIETAFGTNLNVSSAGALGWMQFIPSTWRAYGVDANGDGRKDPYNPVDAICAAARYLKAAGGDTDIRKAIFSYNHADWYVDEVLLYAQQYGKLPSGIVDSLTGLTEGAHFPVAAKARYADDISERAAVKRSTPRKGVKGNAADVISGSPTRRGINIYAKKSSPVVAVNDGVVKKVGHNKHLGNYLVLRDAYGNEFTYSDLGKVAKAIPVPKKDNSLTGSDFKLVGGGKKAKDAKKGSTKKESSGPVNTENARARVAALPDRKANRGSNQNLGGQLDQVLKGGVPGYDTVKNYLSGVLRFDPKTMDAKRLRAGSKVVAGTVLGQIGNLHDGSASHLHFAIKPAGKGARKIDPKPILDGWKLLEATAIYRAAGQNPFDESANVGQVLLMSKSQLMKRVLKDPALQIYSCGRADIRSGRIDRRVLAVMEYLVARGYHLTITSLECGHSKMTVSGNVSAHWTGDAIDIAQVNGIPILGNQGPGSITEDVINDLLKLQGSMRPAQIISLMDMGGPTFSMPDHNDHIHVGYTPSAVPDGGGSNLSTLLKPAQWDKLLNRIGKLDQPKVPTSPSDFALPDKHQKRSSNAHLGE